MQFVSELLSDKGNRVFAIHPTATVLDAVREMDQKEVGALVVLEDGALRGVLSERDYARRVILRGRRSDETRVEEIMTVEVVTVAPSVSVDECMELMTEHRVRHLPVLDGGRVVGVISIGDLVRAIMHRQRRTIEHLKNYIAG
ncbi:MAG: CBS domain-containing protein [Sphingomonadales bacterium]|nr:CBS domain-containing protein [Sphingomonadales bacterium]